MGVAQSSECAFGSCGYNGLGQFIRQRGRDWRTFFTGTFGVDRNRRLMDVCNWAHAAVWRITGFSDLGVWVMEKGSVTGRYHVHALTTHSGGGRVVLSRLWRLRFGIESASEYETSGGAESYIAKYATKDAYDTGSWDITAYGKKYALWSRYTVVQPPEGPEKTTAAWYERQIFKWVQEAPREKRKECWEEAKKELIRPLYRRMKVGCRPVDRQSRS